VVVVVVVVVPLLLLLMLVIKNKRKKKKKKCIWGSRLVIESPAGLGLFAFFGRTKSETGPHLFQIGKKPDRTM
jgi:hypothetical protein